MGGQKRDKNVKGGMGKGLQKKKSDRMSNPTTSAKMADLFFHRQIVDRLV